MNQPIVLKFGGSSIGSPERFNQVVKVINRRRSDKNQVMVIASALSGVTNKLVSLCDAHVNNAGKTATYKWLFERHRLHAAHVLSLRSQRIFDVFLKGFLANHSDLIYQVAPAEGSARRDVLLAMGERLSTQLLSLALEDQGINSCTKDAAKLIMTDDNFGEAVVDLNCTRDRIKQWAENIKEDVVPVITGFIGSTVDGRTTTLGRGGSDYSASLVAASVNALRLERWTDVDGIYSSDPRQNDKALRYEEIVLEDTVAWNRAGKLGMHRKALDPLVRAKIPVFVRSIDHLDWPGTVIRPKCHKLAATG